MKLTTEEVKEIAAAQLTPEELLVLRLLARLDPPDLAELLGTSRQYVHQTRDRAKDKLLRQGDIAARWKREEEPEEQKAKRTGGATASGNRKVAAKLRERYGVDEQRRSRFHSKIGALGGEKSRGGFHSLAATDPEKLKAIARMGGKASRTKP